jgi:RNA polymerase sigma-70 factor (ECF subfamily)
MPPSNPTFVLSPDRLPHHLPRLRRFARHLCGSPDAADDLVQDTLERVLRSKRRLSGGGDEYPYLARAMRNTHVDRVRAAGRQVQTVELLPETSAGSSAPAEDRTAAAIDARAVLDAIAALPGRYRDVVVAVDVQGFSYAEAAELLHIPIGTVMSRLYRGRERVIAVYESDEPAGAGSPARTSGSASRDCTSSLRNTCVR